MKSLRRPSDAASGEFLAAQAQLARRDAVAVEPVLGVAAALLGATGEVDDLVGLPQPLGHLEMDVAIMKAVKKWRFKPATENGVPVSAPFTVDISFRGND